MTAGRAAPPTVPGALPVLGHAGALLRDPLGFLCRLLGHGEIVTVRLGRDGSTRCADRWLPGRASAIPKHAMIPFGVAARKCPGERYALTEVAVLVATIAYRWRLTLTTGTEPSLRIAASPCTPVIRFSW
ncbi:cytochrome P450 [Prauserella shujinwangii]|uniref:Cytochrome P450 n=1 Tax=Prauserella shujinwangii TaxID=1453103 RepID=A0A2T0LNV4_9PSEU|nr:cytochrome P450 [Prauserella shujinwangii]PRX44931.1 cytochrome P450 [Prauserella shujinwangii]